MHVGAEKLCRFFDSSPQGTHRQVWEPLSMELFHREAMGKHVDHLGNTDTCAFNGEFTTCPIRGVEHETCKIPDESW